MSCLGRSSSGPIPYIACTILDIIVKVYRSVATRKSSCALLAIAAGLVGLSYYWPAAYPGDDIFVLSLQEPVGGTLNASATAIQNVRVDHGRADIAVTEQLLYGPDIVAVFQ